MPLEWKHPFTCICAGPSGCGKTTFVSQFITNLHELIEGDINRIIWCCASGSEPQISGVEFENEIPNFENLINEGVLCIIDDLMYEAYDRKVSELFTRGSHHFNISVILITQNVFYQSPQSRNISLNSKYIVVFRNPRDKLQFTHLARQVYPENSSELVRVYKDITTEKYGYLVLDLSQETDDKLRFRSKIFPNEVMVIYIPSHLIKDGEKIEI